LGIIEKKSFDDLFLIAIAEEAHLMGNELLPYLDKR